MKAAIIHDGGASYIEFTNDSEQVQWLYRPSAGVERNSPLTEVLHNLALDEELTLEEAPWAYGDESLLAVKPGKTVQSLPFYIQSNTGRANIQYAALHPLEGKWSEWVPVKSEPIDVLFFAQIRSKA